MSVIKEPSFKILVASEDLNFRNNLAAKLRMDKFEVELAIGGFHLLHLLETNNDYSLIIINENMKDMPGFEAISLIRITKTKKELPILYVSKNDSEDEVCDLVFMGANEYIVQSTNYSPIIERAKKYYKLIPSVAA